MKTGTYSRAMHLVNGSVVLMVFVSHFGCASVPQNTILGDSPLEPGIYSGEMSSVSQTSSQGQSAEETFSETVTIIINDSGIPLVYGEEIAAGRVITADFGAFTQTITYRSVVITDDGVVVTSDVQNSNGSAGVATATFRPSGQGAMQYTLEQDIRDGVVRLTVASTGTLRR